MLRPAWRVVVHISYHVNHGCHAPGITRLHCRCGGGPGGRGANDALINPSAPIEAIASSGGLIENRPFMLTLKWTQRNRLPNFDSERTFVVNPTRAIPGDAPPRQQTAHSFRLVSAGRSQLWLDRPSL